jgi:hypothetical protein
MTDIVNLRQARKQKLRADKSRQAAENRVQYGRTKADKNREAAQAKLERDRIDNAKILPKK